MDPAQSITWRKSSLSGANGDDCVEVTTDLPGLVAVRDSKNPSGPALAFTPTQWRSFVGRVRTGAFDA
ncbi:DUF397 domain-containing protein [Streptosporangium saharense]|uniref:DUF397 domain-containing protein n=1 Tax=Streptosporangium saharense TaxID=1706840 RepID=UPI00343AA863